MVTLYHLIFPIWFLWSQSAGQKMSKKKVKPKKKSVAKKPKKKTAPQREKAFGDPMIVRPVTEFYNVRTGEIYPKIFFRKDTFWDKIKRFFGYIP